MREYIIKEGDDFWVRDSHTKTHDYYRAGLYTSVEALNLTRDVYGTHIIRVGWGYLIKRKLGELRERAGF